MDVKSFEEMDRIRQKIGARRQRHILELAAEAERLGRRAAELGVERVILFGSSGRGQAGLTSDLDLLVVWDTPLDFLERSVTLYRNLQPRVALDLLVYTPEEIERLQNWGFIHKALEEGKVLYEA